MALATQDEARRAQAEANRLIGEAAEAENELKERRAAAARAQAEAEEAAKAAEREHQGWILNTGKEVRTLKQRVETALRAVPELIERPDPLIRATARAWLHSQPLDPTGVHSIFQTLGSADAHLGGLYTLQLQCATAMGRVGEVGDDALAAEVDRLECACHRAVLARVALLAGESES